MARLRAPASLVGLPVHSVTEHFPPEHLKSLWTCQDVTDRCSPDLNLHHIEPARMLGDEMKLQPTQHFTSRRWREDLVVGGCQEVRISGADQVLT